MAKVLELKGITKAFPGVLSNDHIDLTLRQGEIHALLGENGAGKTTLMNILYGLYQPDEGSIYVNGQVVQIHSPNDALAMGIGMVHQHFMLIPVFTVAENVMLGDEETYAGGFLHRASAAARIEEISQKYKLQVDATAYIRDLPVGVQQRVEIIKLLYRQANILIFDEPTAVLTPQETEELFKVMHSLTAQGKSIIFITHKLHEALEIANRITVIRTGRVIGTTTPAETSREELARMMVGREVALNVQKKPAQVKKVVLDVKNLSILNDQQQVAVDSVSFQVRAGEVLGIAGIQGNGQTELVEALTGLRQPTAGTVTLTGNDITHASPRRITELGTAHIPEDRQKDGLVLSYPISDNLVLNTYYRAPFTKGGIMQTTTILEQARELVKNFDIRTPSIETKVSTLSGGNQQKVIIAREFTRPIHLLVASNPTRGLDVGSIEYIHTRLLEKRDSGCAILLVSPELEEILKLSDQIAVMHEGKIIEIVSAEQATKERLGLLMAGVQPS